MMEIKCSTCGGTKLVAYTIKDLHENIHLMNGFPCLDCDRDGDVPSIGHDSALEWALEEE